MLTWERITPPLLNNKGMICSYMSLGNSVSKSHFCHKVSNLLPLSTITGVKLFSWTERKEKKNNSCVYCKMWKYCKLASHTDSTINCSSTQCSVLQWSHSHHRVVNVRSISELIFDWIVSFLNELPRNSIQFNSFIGKHAANTVLQHFCKFFRLIDKKLNETIGHILYSVILTSKVKKSIVLTYKSSQVHHSLLSLGNTCVGGQNFFACYFTCLCCDVSWHILKIFKLLMFLI